MSEFLQLQLLAILQGLTEFLPVSSSGHLALLQNHLTIGDMADGPLLEILLHGGTLIAVLWFYRKRILQLLQGLCRKDPDAWKYSLLIVIACIPAGIVYFLAHDAIESAFDSPKAIGAFLVVTGLALLSLRFKKGLDGDAPTWKKALGIGIAQALAILPGISRSGSTYTAARWLNVSSKEAFDFSFLASVPLIGGAIILKFRHFSELTANGNTPGLVVATILSAIVGYAALWGLSKLRFLGKFWVFGIYCLAIGVLALLFA